MGQTCEMGQYGEHGSSGCEQKWWEPSGEGRRQHARVLSASFPQTPIEMTPAPVIKAEPKEVNQFLNVPAGKKIEFAGQLTSLCITQRLLLYREERQHLRPEPYIQGSTGAQTILTQISVWTNSYAQNCSDRDS